MPYMRMEVRNQLTMLDQPVAMEVEPLRESHRRWLRIASADEGVQMVQAEVPRHLDPEQWPTSVGDYVLTDAETFASLDDALAALRERGVDTDGFEPVWKFENPF